MNLNNRTSDNHILNVREEDFPEKYRPLIRRLQMAAVDSEVKHRMEQEDIHLRYVQNVERAAHHKGRTEEKEEAVIRGYKKGHSIEIIAEFTDLDTEQIKKILKENKLT